MDRAPFHIITDLSAVIMDIGIKMILDPG